MNYQKIHDAIIQSARLRQYVRKEHHLHHVQPKHEVPDSTDVVPLTVKEHKLIHRIRFILTGTMGNYLAWKLIAKQISDPTRILHSVAGMMGGAITRANNYGIFQEHLQCFRSEWGRLGRQSQSSEQGFCSPNWREQNEEQVIINASNGGKIGGKKVGSMYWWNDGVINKKSFECPGEGWVRGMLMSEKKRQQVQTIAGHNKKKEV